MLQLCAGMSYWRSLSTWRNSDEIIGTVIITLPFGDDVQLLGHDRMIENNECLMWKVVRGQPILRSYLTSAWSKWRKTWYISVTIGSCWVEIWTRHLLNMSCTSYHCVNLLAVTSFSHNYISILWFHVPDNGRITIMLWGNQHHSESGCSSWDECAKGSEEVIWSREKWQRWKKEGCWMLHHNRDNVHHKRGWSL